MSGRISDDPAVGTILGAEIVPVVSVGANKSTTLTAIAAWLSSLVQTLTNKTINGSNNTISNLTTTMFAANVIDTDGTLAANSDTRISSQKAIVTYLAGRIAALDVMVFKGVIDCSANPNYPAADAGATYRVSVAGKIGGASGVKVESGDMLFCTADSTASGTQAAVGASWDVVQTNLDGAVIGPSSAVDATPAVFDGVTGKLLKNVTFAAFKTALAVAVSDLNDVAWTSYTPTMTMTTVGGTPITTSVTSAKYKVIGNTCFVELDVSISNVGSGNAGAFVISSPTTMPSTGIPGVAGKEIGVSQKSFKALNFTTTQFYVVFDDGTGIVGLGNGTRLQMAGMYRVL